MRLIILASLTFFGSLCFGNDDASPNPIVSAEYFPSMIPFRDTALAKKLELKDLHPILHPSNIKLVESSCLNDRYSSFCESFKTLKLKRTSYIQTLELISAEYTKKTEELLESNQPHLLILNFCEEGEVPTDMIHLCNLLRQVSATERDYLVYYVAGTPDDFPQEIVYNYNNAVIQYKVELAHILSLCDAEQGPEVFCNVFKKRQEFKQAQTDFITQFHETGTNRLHNTIP